MAISVGQSVHHFNPDKNISTTIKWIAMKFTDIHVPQRMKSTDFNDPLTFLLNSHDHEVDVCGF